MKDHPRSILFISYDGLTDPLGQSQILPYLLGLDSKGHQISILSCEKEVAYKKRLQEVKGLIEPSKIKWHYLPYKNSPPLISTYFLIKDLKQKALEISSKEKVKIVHCRSLIPAMIGAFLKARLGVRFIFDIRGFWADERVEGGLWNRRNPLFNALYHFFKKKEERYFESADQVISLTNAAKKYIEDNFNVQRPLEVIPCSAKLEQFSNIDQLNREKIKKELDLPEKAFVLSYLGSLGTRYLLDDMMKFFSFIKAQSEEAIFLFVTNHNPKEINATAEKYGLAKESLRVVSSPHSEVQDHLSLSQANIFFIKSSFTGLAVSPTKMGEALACGIPVIANSGVGDTAEIIESEKLGIVLKELSEEEMKIKAKELLELKIPAQHLRNSAAKYFALESAINTYHHIYSTL